MIDCAQTEEGRTTTEVEPLFNPGGAFGGEARHKEQLRNLVGKLQELALRHTVNASLAESTTTDAGHAQPGVGSRERASIAEDVLQHQRQVRQSTVPYCVYRTMCTVPSSPSSLRLPAVTVCCRLTLFV
jgi:hypothetical protein